MELYARLSQRTMGNTLPEGLRLTIVEAANFLAHTGCKHIVNRFDDLCSGAKIVAEEHFPALPGLRILCGHIPLILFQKDSRIRQPELVNRLFYVTDHKAIVPFPGQCREDRILHAIGVLIFIHHDLPEPTADFRCGSGWSASMLSQQKIQGHVLQITEINAPSAALRLGIRPIKGSYQTDDAFGAFGRLSQILQNPG